MGSPYRERRSFKITIKYTDPSKMITKLSRTVERLKKLLFIQMLIGLSDEDVFEYLPPGYPTDIGFASNWDSICEIYSTDVASLLHFVHNRSHWKTSILITDDGMPYIHVIRPSGREYYFEYLPIQTLKMLIEIFEGLLQNDSNRIADAINVGHVEIVYENG